MDETASVSGTPQKPVNPSVQMVRDGIKLQELFESPGGRVIVKILEDLYADSLASMLDPERQADDLLKIRLRCNVILDVANEIGLRTNMRDIQAIQRRMAERNIRDELSASGQAAESYYRP